MQCDKILKHEAVYRTRLHKHRSFIFGNPLPCFTIPQKGALGTVFNLGRQNHARFVDSGIARLGIDASKIPTQYRFTAL